MKKRQVGFTLVELIIVVAIVAVLAGLVLPRLDGIMSNANHAAAASSATDAAKFIDAYHISTKTLYPDGWDSLMGNSGTALWPASTSTVKGLHPELSGTTTTNSDTDDTSSTGKLTTMTLTAAELTGLNSAGIYTFYNVDASIASSVRPGDAFNTTSTLTGTPTVATINATSTGGMKIIDHIYRQNKIVGATSGTLPTGTRLLVVGLGQHNSMIGTWMREVPEYRNLDVALTYDRLLVIFELATSTSSGATKVSFKTVLGSDGDLIDDMAASMDKVN